MKAVCIESFSRDLNIAYRDVSPPPSDPAPSQVVVRVRAAGLNRADLLQAAGLYPPPEGFAPDRPGLEFAGEVMEIGNAVTCWGVGDRVFGITAGEAQAEVITAYDDELARIPDKLSFTEAGAVPEAFMTAYDAVFSQAKLREGETLLVHAVGSGVGLAALQLAAAAGVEVIGTSRTAEKLERCKELGLSSGIVTEGRDFAAQVSELTSGRGVDVILDLVGGNYFEQNLQAIAQNGRWMLVGITSGRTASLDLGVMLKKRATLIGTTMRARSRAEKASVTGAFSRHVVPSLASGAVRPNLDRVFSASEAADAYRYLASNQSFGKVVLEFN